jgi:cystathionine beta-lyase/cystathionine gamma-synthase
VVTRSDTLNGAIKQSRNRFSGPPSSVDLSAEAQREVTASVGHVALESAYSHHFKGHTVITRSGLGSTTTLLNSLPHIYSFDRSQPLSLLRIGGVYGGTKDAVDILEQQRYLDPTICNFTQNDLASETHLSHFLNRLADQLLKTKPRVVFFEQIVNPTLEKLPVKEIIELVKRCCPEAIIVVDDTFNPVQSSILWGADYTVISGTKHLGFDSTCIAGLITVSPDQEMATGASKTLKAIRDLQCGPPSDLDCGHLLTGLQGGQVSDSLVVPPLPDRFESQKNATRASVKELVKSNGLFERVSSDEDSSLFYFTLNRGMFSTEEDIRLFLDSLSSVSDESGLDLTHCVSLGSIFSYICRPATETHDELNQGEREAIGIFNGSFRVSLGYNPDSEELGKSIGMIIAHAAKTAIKRSAMLHLYD